MHGPHSGVQGRAGAMFVVVWVTPAPPPPRRNSCVSCAFVYTPHPANHTNPLCCQSNTNSIHKGQSRTRFQNLRKHLPLL